ATGRYAIVSTRRRLPPPRPGATSRHCSAGIEPARRRLRSAHRISPLLYISSTPAPSLDSSVPALSWFGFTIFLRLTLKNAPQPPVAKDCLPGALNRPWGV